MAYANRVTNKFWGLILILCLTRVSHGKLMCYVCDDCAQITAHTLQTECNEDFFNTSGPTDSSVQTTTEHTTTAATMTEATTTTTAETTPTTSTMSSEQTTITSTTEAKSPESTSKASTEYSTETATEMITESTTPPKTTETTTQRSTSTTDQQSSTPAATGTPSTTTTAQTPAYFDTEENLDDVDNLNNRTTAHDQHFNKDEVENIDITNATTKLYKPSAEIRGRQLRSVSDVTYHCFKVEATTVNGTMVVNRGCSRTQSSESVCSQWKAQHTNEKMNKCYPCSRTKCNGGSALTVSITALIVAVVAFFMHRK